MPLKQRNQIDRSIDQCVHTCIHTYIHIFIYFFDPSYGKLICLATLMSSDRTKQICLWMTIEIHIFIYVYDLWYIYILRNYIFSNLYPWERYKPSHLMLFFYKDDFALINKKWLICIKKKNSNIYIHICKHAFIYVWWSSLCVREDVMFWWHE